MEPKTLYFNFVWLLQKRFLLSISRNTQNNNNLTRVSWNKRLITRFFLRHQEINFMTLYKNNSKKIRLKILLVNEGKGFFIFFIFFYTVYNVLLNSFSFHCYFPPPPQFYWFPPTIFYSLLHAFNIFPPPQLFWIILNISPILIS